MLISMMTSGSVIDTSDVTEHAQHDQDQFCFRRAAFYSQLKSKVDNILAKTTTLRININIDDAPIASHAHTHPSHSQLKPLAYYSLPSPSVPPSPAPPSVWQ